jgi:hypothetical protein
MSKAKIHWPLPNSEVQQPLVPYGTAEGVKLLFGILQNQDNGELFVEKAQQDKSYWDIPFLVKVPEGTYSFYLIGFPGGILGSVPDIGVRGGYGGGISQPPPQAQNLTACFTAAGWASPGGTPSGTVTRVSDGKKWTGTNPMSGSSWSLRFTGIDPTPVATSLFNLHIDVSGSGPADNNGLGIPNPC